MPMPEILKALIVGVNFYFYKPPLQSLIKFLLRQSTPAVISLK